jgi:hypothetical protein
MPSAPKRCISTAAFTTSGIIAAAAVAQRRYFIDVDRKLCHLFKDTPEGIFYIMGF